MRWIKRMLASFISPEDIGPGDELVWDTSSLSHAFESFSHAAISAYMDMKGGRRSWEGLKARLLRRIGSESLSRRLLLECDRRSCLAPSGVVEELYEVPAFRDSLDIMMGLAHLVEERYVRRKSGRGNPRGFSLVWKPRLRVMDVDDALVEYVLAVAERMGKRISREDAEGIALAMKRNAVLVTSDRRQAEVADRLGVKVLFTIGGRIAGRKAVAAELG